MAKYCILSICNNMKISLVAQFYLFIQLISSSETQHSKARIVSVCFLPASKKNVASSLKPAKVLL